MARGVDPVGLAKMAKATPFTDAAGAVAGSLIPFGAPASALGSAAGLLTDDFKEHDESALKAFLPGVGAYRLAKRLSSQVKHEQEDARKMGRKDVRPVAHALAEKIGPATSTGLAALLGAAIGGASGGRKGAGIGAGTGLAASGMAHAVAAIAAAVKRRRAASEQMDADSKSVLSKYLVPGSAAYGYFKRMGRSQGDRDDASAAQVDWKALSKALEEEGKTKSQD